MELPTDSTPRYDIFGPHCGNSTLTASESGIVDVLAKLNNPAAPLSVSIVELEKQLRCLEVIQKLNLDSLSKLQTIAAAQRESGQPYRQFNNCVRATHQALQNNSSAKERVNADSLLKTLLQQITPQTSILRESVANYFASKTKENLTDICVFILGSGEEKLKRLATCAFNPCEEPELAYLPYASKEQCEELKKKLDLIRMLLCPGLPESSVRSLFLQYHNSICEQAFAELPEFSFRADLASAFNMIANFLTVRIGLANYLGKVTGDQMFTFELHMSEIAARSLMDLTGPLGVTNSLELQRCALAANHLPTLSPRGFIQTKESTFKELYWPLIWAGWTIDGGYALSPEDQEQAANRIVDKVVRQQVQRAFDNLNRVINK